MHVLLPILDEEIFPEITITIPPLEAEIGRKNRTAGNAGHHADIIDQASLVGAGIDNRLIHGAQDAIAKGCRARATTGKSQTNDG